MSDSEEIIPVIDCILKAPTSAGISEGSPTLTNLDRSTDYILVLKKGNEKVEADQLNVSIRLGLNPNFTNELPEKDMFIKWKAKHPFERLIEIVSDDDSFREDVKDGNKITPSNDTTSAVHVEWNKEKEVNLRIRFNCVSSQFSFKKDSSSRDAIFILVIRMTSKNTHEDLAHAFCQIRLFWPSLAKEANHRAVFRKHDSDQSNASRLPSATETRLRPYDQNKMEILNPDEYTDDFSINEQEMEPFPDDYHEMSTDNYLHYILRDPLANYVDDGAGFKCIFIEHNGSFGIKMRQNSETKGVSLKQIVETRFELHKSDSLFVQRDFYKWNLTKKQPMIEIDYERSHFTFNLLDIRIVKENQIEIAWLPSKEEVVIAFKINCLSKEFCPNQSDLLPLGMPFNFKLESSLKNRNVKLGAAALQIYTTQQGSAEHMKDVWSQRNSNYARKFGENGSPTLVILNDQSGDLNLSPQIDRVKPNVTNFNATNQFVGTFSPYSIHILLVLLAIILMALLGFGKVDQSTIDGLVQQKMASELKRFADIEAKLEQLSKSTIDYQKISKIVQYKLESELKKQSLTGIDQQEIESLIQKKIENITFTKMEQFFLEKLDTELKTKMPEPDYQWIDVMIQEKFDAQLQSQTETKLDMNMIEKIIKDKINAQFRNLSISSVEFDNFNKNVDEKLKIHEQKIQESLKNVSIDYATVDKTIRERVEAESKKIQKLTQKQIEQIVGEKIEIFFKQREFEKLNLNPSDISLSNEESLEIEELIDQSDENDENATAAQNGSSVLEYILFAPTTAGISNGYSSLTNLDRSKWYDLKLKKLDQSLDADKLLVSFQLKLNLIKSSKNKQYNLLSQWKTLHPSERLFDLEYVEPDKSNDNNQVILDNNSKDSDMIDTASFYWNQKQLIKLRIRFNFAHNQFPFKKSLSSKDVTFLLHVKVSSLTKSSGAVIDTSFCQIKLFWPDGAAEANHKANQLLQQAKPYDNLGPASAQTKLAFYYSRKLPTNEFLEDESFVEKLNALVEATQNQAIQDRKHYLHYILIDPTNSFVNVTTNDGNQVKGFFLEQSKLFAIKLLPNAKILPELDNSIVRIRFELNTNARPFSEEELINWSASKTHPMIEIDYLRSKLYDTVYDIRQIDVNCIEVIWLPQVDQTSRQFEFAFKINSNEKESFFLQINTYMTKNGSTINSLDAASSAIFITETGEALKSRQVWLQQNAKSSSKSAQSVVLILNDPSVIRSKSRRSSFSFNIMPKFSINYSIITGVIVFLVRWAVRIFLALMVGAFVNKNYRTGLSPNMSENVAGLGVVVALVLMIIGTFLV